MPRQFDDLLCTEHSPSVKDVKCHKGIKRARKDGFSDSIEDAEVAVTAGFKSTHKDFEECLFYALTRVDSPSASLFPSTLPPPTPIKTSV